MIDDAIVVAVDARLVRAPVDPPRGDAIQKFDDLELPIIDITGTPWHALRLHDRHSRQTNPPIPQDPTLCGRHCRRSLGRQLNG